MFNILLVDDNPDLRDVFQLVLEEQGYRVLTASNGKEGLNTAIAHLPDAILTDWHMPEADGWELCRQVRGHPVLASVPIAVISARHPPARKQALWTLFLQKPVNVETLKLSAARLLAGRLPRTSARPFQSSPAPTRWQPVLSKCWP
ncbi:response regulator [Paraburkholderia dilworthii]|uniref:response regulator n=1 Tax=Paraburkholderia dilworthii TaxID=948106 RepID=UPI00047FAC1C|nr:response regulator [Paraburkholderia dilworthii]